MGYIDVLIPGVIGILLIASPRTFTKATGEKFDEAKKKFRLLGILLVGVAIVYLVIKLGQSSQ